MPRRLGRSVVLSLGQAGADGLALLGLRVSFDVRMSRSSTPNKAKIKVWNPRAISTAILDGPLPSCTLAVGYADADTAAPALTRLIFTGDVTSKRLTRTGPDRILELECQDGGRKWQHGRVEYMTVAPTTLGALIPIAAAQAGVVLGAITPNPLMPDVALPHGAFISEPFRDFMDRAAASLLSTWTITDRLLFVTGKGVPAPQPSAPLFSSVTGTLVGSPVPRERNGVEIRALLDASIRPGGTFAVASTTIQGTYIAQDVRFIGDSGYDQPFYVEIDGRIPGSQA